MKLQAKRSVFRSRKSQRKPKTQEDQIVHIRSSVTVQIGLRQRMRRWKRRLRLQREFERLAIAKGRARRS